MSKLEKYNYTTSEDFLWKRLRNRQVNGFKFRRQHLIGCYVVDFFCFSKKLAIEVDGLIHKNYESQDKKREIYLAQKGISILRFSNYAIYNHIDKVLEEIVKELQMETKTN
ncbi:endonuclease domain-containing protein [Candidatus Uabimicrobium amorphum]|uniref:Endonuclease n=1 Tax=Uabimicrobium amorphum TaxID=2596890 RepID=A0A5S9IUY4_UABAM|nr:endonuclease domain-containing protein [Candidatus Uabimicrobium amorphum]BBM87791.1 endonuclease [Candidatus Uabimicrobium amorphum]